MPVAPEPLNYTSKAIVSFEILEHRLKAIRHPDLAATQELIQYLRKAVVFVLPQTNDLIDMPSLKRATDGMDMPRLPFPVCAFESHFKTLHLNEQFSMAFPKRISLCIDVEALEPGIIKSTVMGGFATIPPEGAVVAFSLSEIPPEQAKDVPEDQRWHCLPFAGIIPRTPTTRTKIGQGNAYFQIGIDSTTPPIQLDVGYFLAPVFESQAAQYLSHVELRGDTNLMSAAAGDLFDEMLTPIVVTAILSCRNSRTETVEPPAKLNKKRVASGKPPIPGYSYIAITPHAGTSKTGGQGGTHASPKTHLRRGHIRRYQETGKSIWVQATVVNPATGNNNKQVYKIR